MDNALVTGAAGFMGSHLARELRRQSRCQVVALDDLSGGYRENLPKDVAFVKGSVVDAALMADLFDKHNFRYVYHLAAYAAEGLSHFIRRFNYTNNVVGSMVVVNEAIKHEVECLVFTSSVAVYGEQPSPLRENVSPQPLDPYGIGKYAVELDLQAAHSMFGLDHVIFRPHNVYGERQNIYDKYRNVIGIFMNQIMNGEPMTIFGDGEQERAFSYIGDLIGAMASAPWVPGARNRVFNIGADQPYTVNALACEVARAMGVPEHPVVHLPPRNEVRTAYSDHVAAREVFGAMPETPLGEGLVRMAEWVRSRGPRESREFGAVEVAKNLPPSWVGNVPVARNRGSL